MLTLTSVALSRATGWHGGAPRAKSFSSRCAPSCQPINSSPPSGISMPTDRPLPPARRQARRWTVPRVRSSVTPPNRRGRQRMALLPKNRRLRKAMLVFAAAGALVTGTLVGTGISQAAYTGRLYQVRRSSDNTTRDISTLSAGGVANAASQDSFCANTSCVITIIYDQSGRGNNLTQAPPGGFSGPAAGGFDNLANATAAPTTL